MRLDVPIRALDLKVSSITYYFPCSCGEILALWTPSQGLGIPPPRLAIPWLAGRNGSAETCPTVDLVDLG